MLRRRSILIRLEDVRNGCVVDKIAACRRHSVAQTWRARSRRRDAVRRAFDWDSTACARSERARQYYRGRKTQSAMSTPETTRRRQVVPKDSSDAPSDGTIANEEFCTMCVPNSSLRTTADLMIASRTRRMIRNYKETALLKIDDLSSPPLAEARIVGTRSQTIRER